MLAAAERDALAGLWFDLHSREAKLIADKHGWTREQFIAWAKSRFWLHAVVLDGGVAGVIALGQGRIHVAIHPWAKGRWLRDLERVLRDALKNGGELEAWVDAHDDAARYFVVRCGAVLKRQDENVRVYRVRRELMWFSRRREHGRTG